MDKLSRYTLVGSQYKTNWALLLLIFMMPLRNIQLQYIPNLGGGMNIVNILFFISLMHSFINGKKSEVKLGLNSYLVWYILSGIVALFFGYSFLEDDASGYWKAMKDQLIPIFLVFIIQRSARDMIQWRRIFLVCLLPLPYCFKVVLNQYLAVSSWHYSHDLRIAGTFTDLGANEMGAYSATLALVCLGCILSCWSNIKLRTIFIIFFVFSGTCLLYSYSRGGYVAFILGVILIMFRYKNTSKLLLPLFIVMAIGLGNLPPSIQERFSSINSDEKERDESAHSRFVFWEVAFNKFLERPIFGYGFGTVQDARVNPYEMDTHNYYVKMLVERGLLGFVSFILLLKIFLDQTKRNLNWVKEDMIVNGLMLGMGGAVAALMLGNMFGDRFSHYTIMTSFWTFIALISVIEIRRLENE